MSFFSEINWDDLQLLRGIVRRVHMKKYPEEMITSRECDRIIEAIGPVASENLIKLAVEQRVGDAERLSEGQYGGVDMTGLVES